MHRKWREIARDCKNFGGLPLRSVVTASVSIHMEKIPVVIEYLKKPRHDVPFETSIQQAVDALRTHRRRASNPACAEHIISALHLFRRFIKAPPSPEMRGLVTLPLLHELLSFAAISASSLPVSEAMKFADPLTELHKLCFRDRSDDGPLHPFRTTSGPLAELPSPQSNRWLAIYVLNTSLSIYLSSESYRNAKPYADVAVAFAATCSTLSQEQSQSTHAPLDPTTAAMSFAPAGARARLFFLSAQVMLAHGLLRQAETLLSPAALLVQAAIRAPDVDGATRQLASQLFPSIARLLAPTLLALGRLPSEQLFDALPSLPDTSSPCSQPYIPSRELAEAIVTGNLGQFDSIVLRHRAALCASFLYLPLSATRAICARSLLQRVHKLHADTTRIRLAGQDSARIDRVISNIPFTTVLTAFRAALAEPRGTHTEPGFVSSMPQSEFGANDAIQLIATVVAARLVAGIVGFKDGVPTALVLGKEPFPDPAANFTSNDCI
jgi:hypothetical protein